MLVLLIRLILLVFMVKINLTQVEILNEDQLANVLSALGVAVLRNGSKDVFLFAFRHDRWGREVFQGSPQTHERSSDWSWTPDTISHHLIWSAASEVLFHSSMFTWSPQAHCSGMCCIITSRYKASFVLIFYFFIIITFFLLIIFFLLLPIFFFLIIFIFIICIVTVLFFFFRFGWRWRWRCRWWRWRWREKRRWTGKWRICIWLLSSCLDAEAGDRLSPMYGVFWMGSCGEAWVVSGCQHAPACCSPHRASPTQVWSARWLFTTLLPLDHGVDPKVNVWPSK